MFTANGRPLTRSLEHGAPTNQKAPFCRGFLTSGSVGSRSLHWSRTRPPQGASRTASRQPIPGRSAVAASAARVVPRPSSWLLLARDSESCLNSRCCLLTRLARNWRLASDQLAVRACSVLNGPMAPWAVAWSRCGNVPARIERTPRHSRVASTERGRPPAPMRFAAAAQPIDDCVRLARVGAKTMRTPYLRRSAAGGTPTQVASASRGIDLSTAGAMRQSAALGATAGSPPEELRDRDCGGFCFHGRLARLNTQRRRSGPSVARSRVCRWRLNEGRSPPASAHRRA